MDCEAGHDTAAMVGKMPHTAATAQRAPASPGAGQAPPSASAGSAVRVPISAWLGRLLAGHRDAHFGAASAQHRESQVALEVALVDHLHRQAPMITLGMCLLGLLTLATLIGHLPSSLLALWGGLVVLISVARVWMHRRYSGVHPLLQVAPPPRESRPGLNVPIWHFGFFLLALLSGFQWGALGVYVSANLPFAESVLFYLTITGAVGASAATTAASPAVFRAYSLPVLLPVALTLMLQPDADKLALGLMTVAFCLLTCAASSRANDMIRRGIAFGLENERLLATSRRAEARFQLLNQQLREEVAAKTRTAHELLAAKKKADALARRLFELSSTDALTGLANRRAFDRQLKEAIGTARQHRRPLALVLCDIDFFKRYNDSLGHPAGDRCLRTIAQALREVPCLSNSMVARYGGEEFAIVLPGETAEQAAQCAELARAAVANFGLSHPCSPVSRSLTISAGVVARVPGPADTAERLLREADRALYQAKQQGRNQVWGDGCRLPAAAAHGGLLSA